MLVLLATSLMAGATLSAVGADMPFTRASQDRKQAYAAAEAGIEYYLYQLTRDNDYWRLRRRDDPGDAQRSPVNPRTPATRRGARLRACRREVLDRAAASQRQDQVRHRHRPRGDDDRPELRHVQDPVDRHVARREALDRHDVPPQQLPRLHLLHRLRSIRPADADRHREQTRARNKCVKYRAERTAWCADRTTRTSRSRTGTTSTGRSTPTTTC